MVEHGMSEADEVLAHREDPDEWDDEPVQIEVRPSGKQVLSARLPTPLADLVFDEAERLNTTLSEVVRAALEQYFSPLVHEPQVNVYLGWRIRVFRVDPAYDTANPVVTTGDLPLRVAG